MDTHETIEAVFHLLLNPAADLIDGARQLGLSLPELLEIAESPQITAAIEALEKLGAIRTRAVTARAAHTAITALERIAASEAQTPAAVETRRKAAAQILRMAAKAEAGAAPASVPLRNAEGVAESSRPGEARAPTDSDLAHSPIDELAELRDTSTDSDHDNSEPAALVSSP